MTKLQKNQLLVLKPVDGSFEPEYFTSFTNALNSIPKMRVSLKNAINNNIPIIYNDKVCTLTVEECQDIEWGQIERHLKGLNHTTRGLHTLVRLNIFSGQKNLERYIILMTVLYATGIN